MHEPPILDSFRSPFLGWTVQNVADWLRNKPETVDLDPRHLAILDRKAKDRTIVVCKIGDKALEGDRLDYLRRDASDAACFLLGIDYADWEFRSADGKNSARIEYGDAAAP